MKLAIDKDGMDLDEVAEILGISRTRVQQIEKTALQKLRNWAKRGSPQLQMVCAHWLARCEEIDSTPPSRDVYNLGYNDHGR